jgi:hypothetical protein
LDETVFFLRGLLDAVDAALVVAGTVRVDEPCGSVDEEGAGFLRLAGLCAGSILELATLLGPADF